MNRKIYPFAAALLAVIPLYAQPPAKTKLTESSAKIATDASGILWRQPLDIKTRNLFYGPGGTKDQPSGTQFTFIDEDLDGTNPKYNVRDSDGVKWKIKLGAEAQPETVASRFVWAVGYVANEDYFLPEISVSGLPPHLHRGQKLIGDHGEIHNARLKRHLKGEEKTGHWRWADDPFKNTREWNGLRVVMALLNNWDLKDENNAVYEEGPGHVYLVSDLGASFGATGLHARQRICKGNLSEYRHSKFMTKVTETYVDFSSPSAPSIPIFFNPHQLLQRLQLRWIGKRVPRQDARWMGGLLAGLSSTQIRDAFRAAGYSPKQMEAFASVVEQRIEALNAL